MTGGEGHQLVTPTKQRFVEADGTDVRLDRIRVFDRFGKPVRSYLQDKMGRRFTDQTRFRRQLALRYPFLPPQTLCSSFTDVGLSTRSTIYLTASFICIAVIRISGYF